jgi:DNA-binding response OmpR family regulator
MFKKPIAIIDDDPDLLNLFSEALQMSGYTVSSFTDPLLAYDVKSNPNTINKIVNTVVETIDIPIIPFIIIVF